MGRAAALAGAVGPAATINVDGVTCTLADAITAANTDAATGGCNAGSGADIIGLQTNVTLTAVNNTTDGNNGLPVIASAVTIEGNGNTISRNSATAFRILAVAGGANLTLNSATVSGGLASGGFPAGLGGGIQNGGMLSVQNSIVAGQTSGGDCDGSGTIASGGYNIESATSCNFTQASDLRNVTSANLALQPLANNGGPTQTMALGFGSVAHDHIPTDVLEANGCGVTVTTDQRGLPRAGGVNAGGSACDVGAYEAQTPPLAVMLASFDAQAMVDHILLSWETVSEIHNAGFKLYRSASPAGPEELLVYVPSQAPGSTQRAFYSFDDMAVSAGQTWYYWLEDVDLNGATSLHGPVRVTL